MGIDENINVGRELQDRITELEKEVEQHKCAYDNDIQIVSRQLEAMNIKAGQLRSALEKIANSPHCSYENNPGQYGTGVADGHRCAANMARAALENRTE